ncbi:class I adenylate-forming enzyme family protein [Reyranella sp. CPCC 100927]|uniref:class I adenylate-forming enzyme family protein n=1 Tax=Reyranella sp. CPCC 100927 TaxID=2599616 RepID=UPI0011B5ABAF|nr:AMP-binding protein [Reyranella sp. CPCC 100927]TWT08635.1 long-chain fatty acid--CoA ligase [Reyranella sp. CPCC 100927]
MNSGTAREAAAALLAGLPDRISHVIRTPARQQSDHPALIGGDIVWTYGELPTIVADTMASLEGYGVRPGDRVMIVGENSLALAALVLASSELGAWAVVGNPRLSDREIDQIRDHSGARRVLYVVEISEPARQHALRHEATLQVVGRLGVLGIGPLNDAAVPEPVEADAARQVAALLYTSGTTGNPKGVMLTHANILFNARVSGVLRQPKPADKIYGVLPMSHIVGFSIILIASLMSGCTVHLVPRYDPAALADAIARGDVTMLFGVPATYQRLLEYKKVAGLETLPRGALQRLFVAGAPLDLALKRRIETEFGVPLLNAFGITECAPGISGVRYEALRQDESVGTVLPGLETRLVGHDGKPVAAGDVGELHVRGPNVMRGYYRAPEATAAAIDADGWFNTGDLARFDGDALFIAGRSKELIIRSGFNVYPAEVEAVLNAHPGVVQSAVVGRAVAGNEEVVAFVQLLPGSCVTSGELMDYASGQLTAYKRPTEIIVLEALPAGSTGKILKHKLAEAAREEAARRAT